MILWSFLSVAAALVGLAGVLLARALWPGTAATAATAAGPTFPAAPAFDVERAARHLGQAIRIPTVSHQDPGLDESSAWEHLHSWLMASYPEIHARAQREIVGGRTLLYTWRGKDPALAPIVLMAHQDVVPVPDDAGAKWRHAPFSGELADGAVWGRGAVDDKGSLVALFEALESLASAGFAPRRTVIIVSGADEEVQGSGATAAAALLASRGIKAEFVLDEGMLVLAEHPVTGGPVAMIGIAEKGYATLLVEAHAPGGHSSMPPADSADLSVAKALLAIAADPPPSRLGGATARMLDAIASDAPFAARLAIRNRWLLEPLLSHEIAATPAGAAMLHTTLAPTLMSGSAKENVLPERASVAINYRLLPGDRSDEMLARARRAAGQLPVSLSWLRPPLEATEVSSTGSRAWSLIAGLAADAAHGPAAPALVIGGTDSRHLQCISGDIYRFQPITLSEADLAMIHGADEHLTLDNLNQSITFYARLIEAATR
jgi:carboxypeptidase PM20D1